MPQGSAIIIFVRHPELGKVKTRLAASIGHEKALAVYRFLLKHTYGVIENSSLPVYIYYADKIVERDIWEGRLLHKRLQTGSDLGARISNAFSEVFEDGYADAVIIGSDCYEMQLTVITTAFEQLQVVDTVIGPARDGGYYLLGMKAPFKDFFKDIAWSTNTVFSKTIEKIKGGQYSLAVLAVLTDVDTESDITFLYE